MCCLFEVINYSWSQFKSDLVSDLNLSWGEYVFRGHANADWNIASSFDRIFAGRSAKDKSRISMKLLELFKNECDGRINLSEDDWLPFARHHGLPTRIIDWTLSPYIAAFFAYSSSLIFNYENRNIAIYALRCNSDLFNTDTGLSILEFKNNSNKRQMNQMGRYTLLNSFHDSIEDYFKNMEDSGAKSEYPILYKFILPVSDTNKALFDLELMGISYSSVFDDMDGYAKSALLKYALINMTN